MVSLLDIGLLKHFEILFPFLFITIMVFSILTMIKAFGKENTGLRVLIAIILGFMSLISPIIRKTINIMAPWFVLLIIFIFFILFAVQTLGGSREELWKGILKPERHYIIVWIVALSLVIGFGSLSSAISEERGFKALAEEGEAVEGEKAGFFQVIFHPKVLGLVLILIISLLTVNRLSEVTS